MEGIFNKCYKLKKIEGIDKFNTTKVTSMRGMFQMRQEEYLDLSNFDTFQVTDLLHMFSKCYKLNEIKGT